MVSRKFILFSILLCFSFIIADIRGDNEEFEDEIDENEDLEKRAKTSSKLFRSGLFSSVIPRQNVKSRQNLAANLKRARSESKLFRGGLFSTVFQRQNAKPRSSPISTSTNDDHQQQPNHTMKNLKKFKPTGKMIHCYHHSIVSLSACLRQFRNKQQQETK